jgi:hypothetical protein
VKVAANLKKLLKRKASVQKGQQDNQSNWPFYLPLIQALDFARGSACKSKINLKSVSFSKNLERRNSKQTAKM